MNWNTLFQRLLISALSCKAVIVGMVHAEAGLTHQQQNEACYGAEIDFVIEGADGAAFAYELPTSIMNWPVTERFFSGRPETPWNKLVPAAEVSVPPCLVEPIVYDKVHHDLVIPKDVFDVGPLPNRWGEPRDGVEVRLLLQAGDITIIGVNGGVTVAGHPLSVDMWRQEIETWNKQGDLGEISPEFLGFFHDKKLHPHSFSPAMVASGRFFEPVTGSPMLYTCRQHISFRPANEVWCETAYRLAGDVFIQYGVSSGVLPFSQWQLLDTTVRASVLSRVRSLK